MLFISLRFIKHTAAILQSLIICIYSIKYEYFFVCPSDHANHLTFRLRVVLCSTGTFRENTHKKTTDMLYINTKDCFLSANKIKLSQNQFFLLKKMVVGHTYPSWE